MAWRLNYCFEETPRPFQFNILTETPLDIENISSKCLSAYRTNIRS